MPDGVFSLPDRAGRADFHPLPPPAADELVDIAFNVHQCFRRWLKNHGLLVGETDDGGSNETPELSALQACTQGAMGPGGLVTVQNKPRDCREHDAGADRFEYRGPRALVGESFGYNLFVADAIPAASRDARERLLRYCLRPQLSLERLSVARDGKIVYQVKATRHGKATQRIMAPLDFMARLVALIPPPYHPILRYFGVFAPHSSWRSAVVPEIEECAEQESEHDHGRGEGDGDKENGLRPAEDAAPSEGVTSRAGDWRSSSTMGSTNDTPRSRALEPVRDGEEPGHRPRWYIDWATLLKRVHSVDALRCPCGGRLRFRQLVTDPEVARTILRSMDLPEEPPPLARARSPTFDTEPLPQDWD